MRSSWLDREVTLALEQYLTVKDSYTNWRFSLSQRDGRYCDENDDTKSRSFTAQKNDKKRKAVDNKVTALDRARKKREGSSFVSPGGDHFPGGRGSEAADVPLMPFRRRNSRCRRDLVVITSTYAVRETPSW